MPMAIITNNRFITTVCLRENAVITEISQGLVKNIQTHLRTQFLLSILLRIATRFLQYLKQIDKISYTTENLLHKTMRNKELVQILGLENPWFIFPRHSNPTRSRWKRFCAAASSSCMMRMRSFWKMLSLRSSRQSRCVRSMQTSFPTRWTPLHRSFPTT